MSKLMGLFTDIEDTEYRLTFTIDDGSASIYGCELIENPFTTEMDDSSGNLYNPVKCQGATARILTSSINDYKFELYSPQAQKVKVELENMTAIPSQKCWVGYVEPSLYDIGYTYAQEEIEINCIDGLASLEYFRYKSIGQNKGIYTYRAILKHILNKCGCYNNVYLPLSQFIDRNDELGNTSIYSRILISEQVFFDRDGQNEKDLTYKQALEALMQYLGLSCVAYGQDVYCLDFDAIKQSNGNYVKIALNDSTPDTQVVLTGNHTITASEYAESNSRLSLDKIYQKASVEDDFYTVDSLMPDLYNENDLQQIYPVGTTVPTRGIVTRTNWCYYRVNLNKNCTFYCYDTNGNLQDITQAILTRTSLADALTELGSVELVAVMAAEMMSPELIPPDIMRLYGQCAVLTEYYNYNAEVYKYDQLVTGQVIQPYFNMSKALVLCVNQDSINNTPVQRKLVTIKPNIAKPIIAGSDDMYIVIEGEVIYQDIYAMFGYDENNTRKEDKWTDDNAYLTCSLEYNGKWWDGTQWQTTQATFPLYLWAEDHKHYINKPLKVKNNVPYTWQMDVDGYAIKLSDSVVSENSFEFSVYTPRNINPNYLVDSVWMRNFNVTLHAIGEESRMENIDVSKSLYYNVDNEMFQDIDENNVDEFSTIKFKLTTYDGKKVAYSCPTYEDNGTSKYVQQILNVNTDELLLPEEHMIARIVRQYSDKTRILELHLTDMLPPYTLYTDDNLDTEFIIDSSGYNYKYKNNSLKLIEKK